MSLSGPATSVIVLVLVILALHHMLITPGPDLTLDIQVWLGLQMILSVDRLSKNIHVFGIATIDWL